MRKIFLYLLFLLVNGLAGAQSKWFFSADGSLNAGSSRDETGLQSGGTTYRRLTEVKTAFSVQYMLPGTLGAFGITAGQDIRFSRTALNSQVSDRYDLFIGPQYHYFFGAPSITEAKWLAGFRYGFFLEQSLFDKDADGKLPDTRYLLTLEAGRVLKSGKRGALAATGFFESKPRARAFMVNGNVVHGPSQAELAAGVRLRFFFTGRP